MSSAHSSLWQYVTLVAVLLMAWITAACGSAAADTKASLSAGGAHACLVEGDGAVYCWGSNFRGEIGNGSNEDSEGKTLVPLSERAVAVAAGAGHTCAVLQSGSMMCWGANARGQLGDGTTSDSRTPIKVKGVTNAVSVDAGFTDTCALLDGGDVMCWGNNEYGQSGSGQDDRQFVATPVKVIGLPEPAIDVAASMNHVCALGEGGSVNCWGGNMQGRLGDGTNTDSPRPVKVAGLDDAVALDAGTSHTCAAKRDGSVVCWGSNGLGELGLGVYTDPAGIHSAPGVVGGVEESVSVALGLSLSCSLSRSGAIMCWGWNDIGQTGSDTGELCAAEACVLTASQVQDLPKGATSISAGEQFVCAEYKDGSAMCWGNNLAGQFGDGTTTSSAAPVRALTEDSTSGS